MPKLIEKRASKIHGNGVFALQDIPKGTEIVEYKGKRISHEEADSNQRTGDPDSGHTFLFTLNDHWIIDATRKGNIARWINHSCRPNCEAQLEEHPIDRRKDKVLITAIRKIRKGEELGYNYQIQLDKDDSDSTREAWECRCGAPNCSGTMLQTGDD